MSLFLDNKYASIIGMQLEGFEEVGNGVYNFRCPLCGDSKRDRLKKRGYFYENAHDDCISFKCHNCGESNRFKWFLRDMDESLFKQYVLELFKQSTTEDEGLIAKKKPEPEPTGEIPVYTSRFLFSLTSVLDLDDSHPCKEYVKNRCIPQSRWSDLFYTENYRELYNRFLGEENDRIPDDSRLVIPFVDSEGKLIGMQGRSLNPKSALRYVTFRHPLASQKVYGLDRIDPSKRVRVVEGPIDSMFLDNCIASADSSLFKFGGMFKDMVFIFDIQPRNGDLLKIIDKTIDLGFPVCLLPDEGYKDINDLVKEGGYSPDDLNYMIDHFTYKGLRAKLEFSKWKKI